MENTKPPLESFFKIKSPIQKEDLDPKEIEVEYKFLRGKRGERGDMGAKPIAGIDYPLPKDGKDGIDGINGKDGKNGKDGREGKDAKTIEIPEIAERVIRLLPKSEIISGKDGINGKDGSPDSPKEIIEKINKARGEKIKKNKIEGFDDIESYARSANDKIQKYLLMGGSTLMKLQSNGTPLGDFSTLNFVNGTVTNTKGTANFTSLGGGGGFTTLAPTETPDGITTVFTFSTATAQPTFIVSDNAMMQATTKSGVVNWTWNAGAKQATMTLPPNEDIIGIQ